MEEYSGNRIQNYQSGQKIKMVFDERLSTWQNIKILLETAINENKGSPVAHQLIGAVLQFRFQDEMSPIALTSFAQLPINQNGDFQMGDTVFYVSITFQQIEREIQKCKVNLVAGLKVYFLVPNSKLAGARLINEEFTRNQIHMDSIESFISQQLDKVGGFEKKHLTNNMKKLISIYNERIEEVAIDESLMIEFPANLID